VHVVAEDLTIDQRDQAQEPFVVYGRPAPVLRRFVRRYVGYRMPAAPSGFHRGVPSPFMTFVVGIHDTIDVSVQSNLRRGPASYRAVLGGLQLTPTLIHAKRPRCGVMIELAPFALERLGPVSAREVWDSAYEATELIGPAGDELWERLQCQASWPERFRICDDVLARYLDRVESDDPASWMWRQTMRSRGALRVERLAAEMSCTRQHLGRVVRDRFGVSPKELVRLTRFAWAAEELQRGVALATVAADARFSDQSHMTREFVALGGCTPGEFVLGR
jgi:AraC-like DNA-binding protein